MGLTLSHQSALDVTRMLRAEGAVLKDMDTAKLLRPTTWRGKRWTMREFDEALWQWPIPSAGRHLDVLIPNRDGRIRMANVNSHALWQNLPPGSILWLDEHATMVCPELLFLQAGEFMPLPNLVMLGNELCGYFSRTADSPLEGKVITHLPAATSVERIRSYLSCFRRALGLKRALEAIQYVTDHALSAPESVLYTIYTLPPEEAGYGMGPITLNEQIDVNTHEGILRRHHRFPDLLFSFAPVGINYDGEDHLDLKGLVETVLLAERNEELIPHARNSIIMQAIDEIRAKQVDDTLRNRQLAARGHLVLPATKEDLYGWGKLDAFTHDLLTCAHTYFDADITEYLKTLDDTDKARDRYALLTSLLPSGTQRDTSYGKL